MLNVAIVGLGNWAKHLVDAVSAPASAKLRFTHAVARTPDKVRAYCSERRLALTDDIAQVLADPKIDAVVLATPHSQHVGQVVAAAEAGKHVFVEKPFALDAAGAVAAARACRAANVVLAPAHNRRFLPAIREIKGIIARGELGQVLHLEANFSGGAGLRYKPGMWRASKSESPLGGMAGMGIHLLDAFINVAGPISAVRCDSHRQVTAVDMDDTTSLHARFASGATAYLSTLNATARMFRFQVFGTKGWLHLLDPQTMHACDMEGKVRLIEFPETNIERAELEAFADAVAGTAAYPAPVDDAVHGVAVFEAAIRSAANQGERVAVEVRGI